MNTLQRLGGWVAVGGLLWSVSARGAERLPFGPKAEASSADTSGASITIECSLPEMVPVGTVPAARLVATNPTKDPVALEIRYSLQRDSSLHSRPVPDPVFGSNHAEGMRSWLVVDGEAIDDSRSTDGKPWTAPSTSWQQGHYAEALQLIDLGRLREIRKMTWLSGDANHAWFVDVFASEDGETFVAVPGLHAVDHHKKWGWCEFPMEKPFRARVVRFCYRTAGKKEDLICFPSELGVYDGAADELVALPVVGTVVEEGTLSLDVPPGASAEGTLRFGRPIPAGAFLLGWSVAGSGPEILSYRHIFGALRAEPNLTAPDSRFAVNAADPRLAPMLKELGTGWVRFENGKWPFVSARPHEYSFTGEVPPWNLNVDEIFQTYRDAGLSVLTYMFLTPLWASSAPPDASESMRLCFPPKDVSLYGEFCFQMAARYGSRKHPDAALLSKDKRSGLGLVKYYEMWNEPNLNPTPKATWGGWAAPMETYYEMMRFGAEAVKRADPDAVVTSAGYAGTSAEVVDGLRTYRYADGKCPLDFIDLINVHYYSGQEPPETCTTDGNAQVTGYSTLPENLRELCEWRDRHAPQMPIWMTETGYDSGGPFGTTEAIQAARLPRVVMLCLANGVERVFVYRESGSTPSKHACSGVLRNDFSRKPAWYTYGTLIRQLRGVRGGARRLPHPDPSVWLLEWAADGKPLLTAWTVDGAARLGIDLGGCTMTDSFGGVAPLGSTEDVEITPYPRYLRDFSRPEPLRELHAELERIESARAERLKRIAALRKYLFDFGSSANVGRNVIEGHRTEYVPVLCSTVWEETRGYGFEKPAFSDEDWPWLRGKKLDRDGTRVRGHTFRFRVSPGEYDLEMKVVPFSEEGRLTVGGVVEGPLAVPVRKKSPVTRLRIRVAGERPVVNIRIEDDYGHFIWLSCIEVLP